MATENKENGHYKSARNAFDDLKIEEKAVFLVESTVSMLVHGIEKAAKTVGEGLDDVFAKANSSCEEGSENDTKKEPAKQKSTRSRTTTRKKSTTSTTKKRTSRTKSSPDKSEE